MRARRIVLGVCALSALPLLAAAVADAGHDDPPASTGAPTSGTTAPAAGPPAGPLDSPVPAAATEGPPIPDLAAFPTARTTGPRPDVPLRESGSLEVTEDGAVVEGLRVVGAIDVEADNVTIRNVRVEATGLYGIRRYPEATGLVIEDTWIIGTSERCSAGVAPSGFVARRLDVSGCEDGLKVGADTTVEDSFVHDLRYGEGAHNDAIQAVGGDNLEIRRNRLEGPWQEQTSAMILQADVAPLTRVRIEGNLVSGGTYTLYVKAKPGQPEPSDVLIRGNVWVRDSWKFGSHNVTGDGTTLDGNLFDDGSPYTYRTR